MSKNTHEPTVSVSTFARRTGYGVIQVYHLLQNGRIKAQKIDGYWAIPVLK